MCIEYKGVIHMENVDVREFLKKKEELEIEDKLY